MRRAHRTGRRRAARGSSDGWVAYDLPPRTIPLFKLDRTPMEGRADMLDVYALVTPSSVRWWSISLPIRHAASTGLSMPSRMEQHQVHSRPRSPTSKRKRSNLRTSGRGSTRHRMLRTCIQICRSYIVGGLPSLKSHSGAARPSAPPPVKSCVHPLRASSYIPASGTEKRGSKLRAVLSPSSTWLTGRQENKREPEV